MITLLRHVAMTTQPPKTVYYQCYERCEANDCFRIPHSIHAVRKYVPSSVECLHLRTPLHLRVHIWTFIVFRWHCHAEKEGGAHPHVRHTQSGLPLAHNAFRILLDIYTDFIYNIFHTIWFHLVALHSVDVIGAMSHPVEPFGSCGARIGLLRTNQ